MNEFISNFFLCDLYALLLFSSENYTEALLDEHDREVQKLKKYYDGHQHLFESLEKWDSYFRQMIEMEVCWYLIIVGIQGQIIFSFIFSGEN